MVFYSMNQVGDEEIIYTPVLYLDTLKVSTYEKSAESVFATGGLKNKQLIKWNYGKTIQLTLEDALFSPASMSMIWGGKLDSRLSDATSLVTKINYANTYGKLRYSTKAYPSPALTENEWEIVFKILGAAITTQTSNNTYYDSFDDIFDNEIKSKLPEEYKTAFRNRYYYRPVMFNGIEKVDEDDGTSNPSKTWTYLYDKNTFGTNFGENYLKISQLNIEGYENIDDNYDDNGNLKVGRYRWYEAKAMPEYIIFVIRKYLKELNNIGSVETAINDLEVVDRMEKCIVTKRDGFEIDTKQQLDNLFRYYADDRSESYTIYYDAKTMLPLVHIQDNQIVQEDFSDNSEAEALSREVKSSGGTQPTAREIGRNKIWTMSQIKSSTSMVGFDSLFKNSILEFLKATDKVSDEAAVDSINDYVIMIKSSSIWTQNGTSIIFDIVSITYDGYKTYNQSHKFKIKMGTTYYKWTRTVKYKEYEDDGILGQSFVINAETFPDDYLVVGETYIRNQKTGKDQRYQIIIYKANVSSDTSITLQADGDPTTFSMTIDVLCPENDIQMELRQIDVEEDKFEGGTRIVPQKGKYTYTPAMESYGEVHAPIDNNEIY